MLSMLTKEKHEWRNNLRPLDETASLRTTEYCKCAILALESRLTVSTATIIHAASSTSLSRVDITPFRREPLPAKSLAKTIFQRLWVPDQQDAPQHLSRWCCQKEDKYSSTKDCKSCMTNKKACPVTYSILPIMSKAKPVFYARCEYPSTTHKFFQRQKRVVQTRKRTNGAISPFLSLSTRHRRVHHQSPRKCLPPPLWRLGIAGTLRRDHSSWTRLR